MKGLWVASSPYLYTNILTMIMLLYRKKLVFKIIKLTEFQVSFLPWDIEFLSLHPPCKGSMLNAIHTVCVLVAQSRPTLCNLHGL